LEPILSRTDRSSEPPTVRPMDPAMIQSTSGKIQRLKLRERWLRGEFRGT